MLNIDYKFIYPLGGLIIGLFTLVMLITRPDIRKWSPPIIIVTIILGPISEYLFFQDYWFPPALLEFNVFGVRVIDGDIILAITAPAFMAFGYFFVRNKKFAVGNPDSKNYWSGTIVFSIVALALFFLLTYLLPLNSIFTVSIAATIVCVFILIKRTDLLRQYLETALIMGTFTFLFYYLFQALIGNDYLYSVWLLDHEKYSWQFLGIDIPITEVLFATLVSPMLSLIASYLLEIRPIQTKKT